MVSQYKSLTNFQWFSLALGFVGGWVLYAAWIATKVLDVFGYFAQPDILLRVLFTVLFIVFSIIIRPRVPLVIATTVLWLIGQILPIVLFGGTDTGEMFGYFLLGMMFPSFWITLFLHIGVALGINLWIRSTYPKDRTAWAVGLGASFILFYLMI